VLLRAKVNHRRLLLAGAAALSLAGCAVLRHRGPVPEEVAASRELSRQGAAAMETGQWDEAESLLRRAIEASPTDSATRRYLAETLWHRGATDEALLQMEAAVRMDGSDASMVVRAGEMLLATGQTKPALRRAQQAIALDPKLASAWALRGRVYWQMNQPDRALADLQRALQYSPDCADVLLDVAAIYRQQGQPARCLTTLHHLLDTYSPGEEPQVALALEGTTLMDLGRPEQAAESLLAASRRGPADADTLYHLAQAQLACGRTAAAAAAAQQALAANASHEGSRQLLSELARRTSPAEPAVR
jgi:tetratricopeptide (TPR) repeat protein